MSVLLVVAELLPLFWLFVLPLFWLVLTVLPLSCTTVEVFVVEVLLVVLVLWLFVLVELLPLFWLFVLPLSLTTVVEVFDVGAKVFVGEYVYVLPLSLTIVTVFVFVVLRVVFQTVVVLVELEFVVLNDPLIEPSVGMLAKLAEPPLDPVAGVVAVPVEEGVPCAAAVGSVHTLRPTPAWLLLF